MNNVPLVAAVLLVAWAGVGCSRSNPTTFQHISVIDSTHLAIHARTGPDAIIDSNGSFSIDGKPVALTAPQQDLIRQYFVDAIALRDDAIATGAAGAGTAAQAIRSVVSGLVSGNPDKIGPEIEAKAARIDERVTKLCADLAALHTGQQALVAQLDVFKPYATIDAGDVASCNSH